MIKGINNARIRIRGPASHLQYYPGRHWERRAEEYLQLPFWLLPPHRQQCTNGGGRDGCFVVRGPLLSRQRWTRNEHVRMACEVDIGRTHTDQRSVGDVLR